MLVQGTATYVAGGPPGERYGGNITVRVNVEEDEQDVKGRLAERAAREVARRLCMKPSAVRITNVELN